MDFIQTELDDVKKRLIQKVPCAELIACVPAMVRIHIKKTEQKQLSICFQFPEKYPDAHILMEMKSKTLSEKMLNGLVKMCEEEAKKYLGKPQILLMAKFINNFVDENPLIVCSDEIGFIKRDLISGEDEIKLKQKNSQILLKVKQKDYFMNFKITVPEKYPIEQIGVDITEHNFPDLLKLNFIGHAVEIARRCVQAPIKKKPKDPPFEPKPALRPVFEFVIRDCIKRYPTEKCPLCGDQALPDNPKDVITDPDNPKIVERVYCGHIYHHGCLDVYLKTPPFEGGKMCPSCGKRIYHDKWKATPQLAEARWAHKQAKQRELEEVVDFLQ